MFPTIVQTPNGPGLPAWRPPATNGTGSSIVKALESAFAAIKADHPELAPPVIITGTGRKTRGLNWGHFGHDRWTDAIANGKRHELFVGGEAMARGGEFVMLVLLHEAAHGLNAAHNEAGTSRGGQYHNSLFLDRARDLDLDYPDDHRCPIQGYAQVTLTRHGKERWAEQIKALDEAITLHLDPPAWAVGKGGRPRRPRSPVGGTNGIKCICACDHIIRVSRKTLDSYNPGSGIRCDDCGELYQPTRRQAHATH